MKIVIGLVTLDSIKPSLFFDILNLIKTGLVSSVVGDIGTLLPNNRNHLIQKLFNSDPDFTHLLFVDSDNADINETIIESLLLMDADIASPLYVARRPPFQPVIGLHRPDPNFPDRIDSIEKFIQLFRLPQTERPIIDVAFTGMGCCLIRREVLEQIPPPHFTLDRLSRPDFDEEMNQLWSEKEDYVNTTIDNIIADRNTLAMKSLLKNWFYRGIGLGKAHNEGGPVGGEDVNFCIKARRLGFSVKCHTGLYVSHIGEAKFNINDAILFWNNPELINRLEQYTYVWRLP